jgi:hypothetical protein
MSVAQIQPRPRTQAAPEPLRSVELAPVPAPVVDASTAPPDESAETNRWLLFLVPPFLVSALFFTLAIGTKTPELIAPALFFGPMVIILGFIYLGLTSDSNSE